MLATIARRVPVSGTSAGSLADRRALPSSTLISMPAGLATLRVPFGPLTLMVSGWTLSSTPLARATGFLATRDMVVSPLGHDAQDFAADALLARLRVGHDALGGGNDGDAEAVEDLGQRVLAAVLAQARARHALQGLDHRLALVVLQGDLQFGLGAFLGDAGVDDVTLALEDVGDRDLGLGGRHLHRRLADRGRILDADQHVGDGISHARGLSPMSVVGGFPAGLAQAGPVAAHGRFAQLVAAQAELAVHAARAAGHGAAVALAAGRGVARQLLQLHRGFHLLLVAGVVAADDLLQRLALGRVLVRQLLALGLAVDHGGLGHRLCPLVRACLITEREAEGLEQGLGFLVGAGGGGDRDVHAAQRVDLVEVDLREDDLFLHAHVVVAAAVERAAGDAAEVADARQRHVDQAVEELVHLRAAQGDLAADRPAVADLERGHRHARLGDHRLLARDLGHVGDGVLEDLLVGRGLAHAHVERDLLQARHLHRIGVAEALHQLRHHFFLVELFKSGGHRGIPQASSASPLERNTRSLRPSSSTLIPMRSPLPVAGLNSITFATWIGASRSTTPPGCPACGFGLVWRLTRFTLDTTTLSPWTLTTSPRLPLSLPVVTTTWSPLRIRFIFLPPLRALRVRARRSS